LLRLVVSEHHLWSVDVALLDHQIDRDLALETADVALAEIVAQFVYLHARDTPSTSIMYMLRAVDGFALMIDRAAPLNDTSPR